MRINYISASATHSKCIILILQFLYVNYVSRLW